MREGDRGPGGVPVRGERWEPGEAVLGGRGAWGGGWARAQVGAARLHGLCRFLVVGSRGQACGAEIVATVLWEGVVVGDALGCAGGEVGAWCRGCVICRGWHGAPCS